MRRLTEFDRTHDARRYPAKVEELMPRPVKRAKQHHIVVRYGEQVIFFEIKEGDTALSIVSSVTGEDGARLLAGLPPGALPTSERHRTFAVFQHSRKGRMHDPIQVHFHPSVEGGQAYEVVLLGM